MLSISTTKLTNLISKSSRGRHGRAKEQQIKEAAQNSFGVKFAADAFSFQIKQMIEQIQRKTAQAVMQHDVTRNR